MFICFQRQFSHYHCGSSSRRRIPSHHFGKFDFDEPLAILCQLYARFERQAFSRGTKQIIKPPCLFRVFFDHSDSEWSQSVGGKKLPTGRGPWHVIWTKRHYLSWAQAGRCDSSRPTREKKFHLDGIFLAFFDQYVFIHSFKKRAGSPNSLSNANHAIAAQQFCARDNSGMFSFHAYWRGLGF